MSRSSAAVRLVAVSALSLGLAGYALPSVSAGAAGSSRSLRADLVSRAGGHASFVAAHGAAGVFFGTAPGYAAKRPSDVEGSDGPGVAANKWLRHYGTLFAPAGQLRASRVDAGPGSGSIVRFGQKVSGLPVIGGELTVALDGSNQLLSVAGRSSTTSVVSTSASVSARAAARVAVANVEKHVGGVVVQSVAPPKLSLFDPRVLPAPLLTEPTTVWDLEVSSADLSVRHRVFVDANTARIVADVNEDPQAAAIICEPNAYQSSPSVPHEAIAPTTVWRCSSTSTAPVSPVAGDGSGLTAPTPASDSDVWNAYRFAHDVDDFYHDLLHRNGITGNGAESDSTVHFCDPTSSETNKCTLPMQNAFWNGKGMVYGDGYTSGLDVVGHEMTHGVTQHMSNLMSYYQSGAINESQSDVMGELIQQVVGLTSDASAYDTARPWQIGEVLPGGPFRSMSDPTADAPPDPDSMTSTYYDATPIYSDVWDGGGVHANAGVGNKAAFLIAAGANGNGTDGTFNNVTIRGVSGADQVDKDVKVANIYYRLDGLMWSSTTYADLYNLLPQACKQLLPTAANPHNLALPTGGFTHITSGDCAQVALAVKATRMNVLPTKAGAATPSPSPFCTNGGSPTKKRLDTFETNPLRAGTYVRSRNTSVDPYYHEYAIGDWWWSKTYIDYRGSAAPTYQKRGSTASLWGDDIDPTYIDPKQSTYSYEDARIRTVSAIQPAVGTFLRFDHSWEFEYGPAYSGGPIKNFDGGRIEYRIIGSSHWYDAGAASKVDSKPLIVNNGYNGTISNTTDLSNHYGDPNPLRGHRGFVRSSHGWTATRLDLSSLKGSAVLLRWRLGADDVGGSFGWYVDNVEVYSCNPTHVSISAPSRVARGTAATIKAHVVRTGTHTALSGVPVVLWEKRPSASTWIRVGKKTTNKYGNARWSRTHTTAEEYRVRMPGKTPFAPSNIATATVRLL